jgi:hypothetical protein
MSKSLVLVAHLAYGLVHGWLRQKIEENKN